jgi:hypothetical protein
VYGLVSECNVFFHNEVTALADLFGAGVREHAPRVQTRKQSIAEAQDSCRRRFHTAIRAMASELRESDEPIDLLRLQTLKHQVGAPVGM